MPPSITNTIYTFHSISHWSFASLMVLNVLKRTRLISKHVSSIRWKRLKETLKIMDFTLFQEIPHWFYTQFRNWLLQGSKETEELAVQETHFQMWQLRPDGCLQTCWSCSSGDMSSCILRPNFRVVTLSDTGDRQLATILENMLYIQSYTLSLMKAESQFQKSV